MPARSFAALLAFVVGDALRVRRRHVESAMVRAGVDDASRWARQMYRNLALGLCELFLMALRPSSRAFAGVALPEPTMAEIAAWGRGAVVATAHTGNWDVCACAVARVAPLSIVTKTLRVRWLDALWQGARRRKSVKLLEIGGAARRAFDALRRGELVAMLIDQAPERRRAVVCTRFLGAPAWVDLAPALVAVRARAPLVIAFPFRRHDGTHAIDVARILLPPKGANRAWAERAMIEATELLEDFVRRRPDQWLWMHRRWKPLPQACPEVLPASGLAGESP